LRKNGFTLEEIGHLTEAEILAFSVAFGEIEGGEWDWQSMCWREKEKD
jgi:hypothetical protein